VASAAQVAVRSRRQDDLQRLALVIDAVGLGRIVQLHVVADQGRRVERGHSQVTRSGDRSLLAGDEADLNANGGVLVGHAVAANAAVDHWSTYVGTGAPRFVLSFDVQTANTWFGQMVVVTKGGIKLD